MKSLFLVGSIFFVLSFCGLSEKLKQLSGGTNISNSNTSSTNSTSSTAMTAEKPNLTSAQQAIVDSGSEMKWEEQGLSWKLPAGWKKTDVKKDTFDCQSPDYAFLLVNISELGDNFPMDISLKTYYDQAMQQLRAGKYESVKMVEIDGIPGVEFTETPPEDKDGPRRHQWIGYRRYLGNVQQLNVMTTTRGTNFAKHTDDFTAILYSMKAVK